MSFQTEIQAKLHDAGADIFTTAEIDQAVEDALYEFSTYKPREVFDATLDTVASTRMVDLSTITSPAMLYGFDKRSFNPVYGVEYPTGKYPRKYRNFTVIDEDLEIDLASAPSASSETINIRYYAAWTEATIPDSYDEYIIDLATARVLTNQNLKHINDIIKDGAKFDEVTVALDEMIPRIDNAVALLSTGEDLIADKMDEAITAIDNMTTEINDAQSAVQLAEEYFNDAAIGQPEVEYMSKANMHLNTAGAFMTQASGYLNIDSTPRIYQAQATAELQSAIASLRRANANLDKLRARIQASALADKYLQMGNQIVAVTIPKLRKLGGIRAKQKTWSRY